MFDDTSDTSVISGDEINAANSQPPVTTPTSGDTGGPPPDVSAPSSAPDISASTGGSAQPTPPPPPSPVAQPAPPSSAVDIYGNAALPPAARNAAAMGDYAAPGVPTTPPVVPQMSGQQSPWKNLVMGALFGATQGAGGKGFGQGMERGSAAVQNLIQQNKDNQVRQQQLQFQSVEAAASVARASREAQMANDAHETHQVEMDDAHQKANDWAEAHFQPKPYEIGGSTPAEMQAAASGALTTVSNANGGTVPQVTTTNSVIGQGDDKTNHKINIYAPTATDVTDPYGNISKGAVDAINLWNKVQNPNAPDMTDADIKRAGAAANQNNPKAGVQTLWARAQQGIIGQPELATKGTPDEINYQNGATQNHLEQQLNNYKNSPNPDGPTVAALQQQLDGFKSGVEEQRRLAADNKAASVLQVASAEASAAGLKKQAEEIASAPFKQAQARYEQSLKDGDPVAAGALLAQGLVSPSQIISSRQPNFAQKAFKAANDYSLQTTGKPFNAQVSEGYFKSAQSQNNVTFFGSAKSLTDQGGTLDQLEANYKALPNGKIPAFNKISDWASAAAGKGPIAAFAQTAVGVADDYAKVMGGGQGSDTSRKQVLDSFAAAKSPEQMAGAIAAARQAVDSQMAGRIGTNPVMKGMYGDQMLIHVKDPKGGDHVFRNQADANKFKQVAGIQ